LFCHVDTGVPFNQFTLERFGGIAGRLLAVEARAAHDRFDLTHRAIVHAESTIRKLKSYPIQDEPEGEVRFQHKMSLERMAG
jgi:hypothetical protein